MNSSNSIAIIGTSCRFPGVANPDSFWNVLKNKVNTITEIPADRWNMNDYYDPDKEVPGKMHIRHGGFIQDVSKFDNNFFNISPIESESLDPQIRLLLELSYETLENANVNAERLRGTNTGVFVGMSIIDYVDFSMRNEDPTIINAYSGSGTSFSTASGRISYAYGLMGPSVTLDSACSSSLVAVHFGAQSLLSRETDLAMACAVNLNLSPKTYLGYSKLNALSVEGQCKAFDASCDGFVRSEGGGIVLMKRYEDALRDGDNILAVILGSAVTNDGTGQGFTVPNAVAQAKAIKMAIAKAGIAPDDITYLEAHGTGTRLGDPIEMRGISDAFYPRSKTNPLYVGSVKTNIGHAEPAAGMAGLIKTILSIQHESLPANLHFNTPNPEIDWDRIPLQVPVELIPWKIAGKPLIAGINSFGLSGTNAHVIISEPFKIPLQQGPDHLLDRHLNGPFILPVSAKSEDALLELSNKYIELISDCSDNFKLASICYSAAVVRPAYDFRVAATGSSKAELLASLSDVVTRHPFTEISNRDEERKVVFIFPGQGSQWIGMGRELFQNEKVFQDEMKECERVFSEIVDWNLTEELFKDAPANRFSEVDIIQPVLFAIQLSLARLWNHWGIKPSFVIGHSMGEVAASCFAGALSLQDAALIICTRSKMVKKLSGGGAMAVVELSMEEVTKYIEGYQHDVSIAASNSPTSVIISGSPSSINKIVTNLEQCEVFAKLIKVDYASHSPQMDIIKNGLLTALNTIRPGKSFIPIVSTVKAFVTDGSEFDPQYWSDNLRNTVLFSQGMDILLKEKNVVFIEISPHPVLIPLVQQCIDYANKNSLAIHSTKRNQPEWDEILNSLRVIFNNHVTVNWEAFYRRVSFKNVKLPTYPWQREHFWISKSKNSSSRIGVSTGNPLLESFIRTASEKDDFLFITNVELNKLTFLSDHKVRDSIVFPAAAYIEQALSAAKYLFGDNPYLIEKISFNHVLPLMNNEKHEVQILLNKMSEGLFSFKICSPAKDSDDKPVIHCNGIVRLNATMSIPALDNLILSQLKNNCSVTNEKHYEMMGSRGILYGPKFKGVTAIWNEHKHTIGEICIDDSLQRKYHPYTIHPVLLDACLQVCLGSISELSTNDTYLPAGMGKIFIDQKVAVDRILTVVVDKGVHAGPSSDIIYRDINFYNEENRPVGRMENFAVKRLETTLEDQATSVGDWLYKTTWEKKSKEESLLTNEKVTEKAWLVFLPPNADHVLLNKLKEQAEMLVVVKQGAVFQIQESNVLTIEIDAHGNEISAEALNSIVAEIYVKRKLQIARVIYLWNSILPPFQAAYDQVHYSNTIYFLQFAQLILANTIHDRLRFFLVTTDTQQTQDIDGKNIWDAPLWGLGKTLFIEYPEYQCTCIDTSMHPGEEEISNLLMLLCTNIEETEFALRGSDVYVARLNKYITPPATKQKLNQSNGKPFKFVIDEPGILENITARELVRVEPKCGEIEVEVAAVGLNFANLMSALGIYPGKPKGYHSLALEFSGRVSKIGEGVKGLEIGAEVMGVGVECLGTHIITNQDFVAPKPGIISFEDAAAIPIAFTTAYAALTHYARLQPGERILIHSASGGVGLAAIQIAQHLGAEIYVTAGTEEKRKFLRSMGLSNVFDSRSLDFADQIMEVTNQEGIDVVLNSLPGQAMVESLNLLRDFGRFLEIGKKDIYNNSSLELSSFRKSISFIFLDLLQVMAVNAQKFQKFLYEIADNFQLGIYRPYHKTVFNASKANDGFHYMAKGSHIGKIVFDLSDPLVMIESKSEESKISEQESFMITGGLGGLGLLAAEYLIGQGAKHIILVGRGAPSQSAQDKILAWTVKGVMLHTKQADVSDMISMTHLMQEIKESCPPLKGIIHAAGVLDDGTFLNLTPGKFRNVFGPKIHGAWSIHQLTLNYDLRFFVLYSSAASQLGSAGQGNYVAANSFLDSLSRYRRMSGLPSNCINWGPISEVGLAASQDSRGKRLDREGINGLAISEYLNVLGSLMMQDQSNICVMKLNVSKWISNNPSYAKTKLLSNLFTSSQAGHDTLRQKLGIVKNAADAIELLENHITEVISGILKTSPSKISRDVAFVKLGLDSLMAVQFRNRIQNDLGVVISVTKFWNYPKISLLTEHIAELIGLTTRLESEGNAKALPANSDDAHLSNLSDDEVATELEKEIRSVMEN
jgi:phthiocerol/phenolphthiocerol synthesis type-I polyketide synthase C